MADLTCPADSSDDLLVRHRFSDPLHFSSMANNPFIDHSATVVSRFPDINAGSSSSPGPSALQYSATGSWPQQQQQQYQQHQQQQPPYQSSGFVSTNPTGYSQQYLQQTQWPQQQQQQQYQAQPQPPYSPTQTSYQSSPSPYGQQFVSQVNPSTAGYPQSQMQAQYTGYPSQQPASYGYQQQHQQPQPSTYGYPPQQQNQQQLLAQFDPYANLGQHPSLLSPTGGSVSGGGGGSSSSSSIGGAVAGTSGPQPGVQHPRQFIHSHKAGLEAWDPPTWKQVQNSFEALKVAWETRKRAAETQVRARGGTVGAPATGFFGGSMGPYGAYGGGAYQNPQAQEIDRLNEVLSPCFFF
jgi:hypothetical protein